MSAKENARIVGRIFIAATLISWLPLVILAAFLLDFISTFDFIPGLLFRPASMVCFATPFVAAVLFSILYNNFSFRHRLIYGSLVVVSLVGAVSFWGIMVSAAWSV